MRWQATLTADGYEPFVHRSEGGDERAAAEFAAQVWLLGRPERRAAKNVSVTVEPLTEGGEGTCEHIWHADPDRHCAKGCGAQMPPDAALTEGGATDG